VNGERGSNFRLLRTERRYIRVRGLVQGVGFRPFVYRLAEEMGLAGWVRNDGAGVEIEAQGMPGDVSALMARLVGEAPPMARVDAVESCSCDIDPEDRGFTIVPSGSGAVTTAIGQDTAVCAACLSEMFDPADRRWRYPFINCTHCGPRYTITGMMPYDRVNTSMAPFPLCEPCRDEYHQPDHRRFHAEPNACPLCGPKLSLLEAYGVTIATRDPVADALLRILTGEIVAVKGLGGFHLVCDARNPEAVERLRSRKDREAKPFAVMVANAASAAHWARLGEPDISLLEAPQRPIVLTPKRDSVEHELFGVAAGLPWIGLMLPYTPLHYLLFHDYLGRPRNTAWLGMPCELALVCTSANPSGEPIARGNGEAVRRLAGIADAFLVHDRNIVVPCDDSVVRSVPPRFGELEHTQFIRRSRGYTPVPIALPNKGPSVLAFGGQIKNTLCLTRGHEAFFSQHIGDLDNPATCFMLDEAAEHLRRILAVRPQAAACDLDEELHASQAAAALAERLGVPLIRVQHHHAHIAAVLAEHGWTEPVLGLALDGAGLGSDGDAWGGEMLEVDGARCTRVAHLRALPMPGGGSAAREPWRMAAGAMHLLGEGRRIAARFDRQPEAARLQNMLRRGTNCPATTSMERWIDAMAGLLGLNETMAFEGEAAMQLEGLATAYGPALAWPFGWEIDGALELDLLPLLDAMRKERTVSRAAAVFHASLVAALEDWVWRAVKRCGLRTVALGGGCFTNRLLSDGLTQRLAARGLRVLQARQAPPNDGGLALGQAWVARLGLD
jgi:hydrogenase maturation protein HypF